MLRMETITDRKDFIKGLLKKDGIISDEDQRLLRTIFLENYDPPTGEDKFKDDEIKMFFIDRHPTYRHTKCIYILLEDGSISTMGQKNLKNTPTGVPSLDGQRKAFRNAINDQIIRKRQPGKEVDHTPPFYVLRDKFLTEKGMAMKDVEVEYNSNEGVFKFKNEELARDWSDYHEKNAKLEAVTRKENQRRLMEFYRRKNSNTPDSSAPASGASQDLLQ